MRIAELIADGLDTGNFGALELGDDALEEVRRQFRRFVDGEVLPHAHDWHLKDELIPLPVVEKMAELGVFGLTVPEEWGGHGHGQARHVRGHRGAVARLYRRRLAGHALGDRGRADPRAAAPRRRRRSTCRRIASGELLPTAVFTEPNTGSDLASRCRTRAVLEGDVYKVQGNKTWITHAARADIMTLLARSDRVEARLPAACRCSWPRSRAAPTTDPFPAKGMSGGEIRGAGLSRHEGIRDRLRRLRGARREPARRREGRPGLQAAHGDLRERPASRRRRAPSAWRRTRSSWRCATPRERIQFAKPLYAFPRVAGKIAWMAVETMIARQLTYFAAREKDGDRRCDIEAGMAEAAGRARRLEQRRQRAADPRRQRLRHGVPGEPRPVRRAHPQHLRGRRRDPGPGRLAAA